MERIFLDLGNKADAMVEYDIIDHTDIELIGVSIMRRDGSYKNIIGFLKDITIEQILTKLYEHCEMKAQGTYDPF